MSKIFRFGSVKELTSSVKALSLLVELEFRAWAGEGVSASYLIMPKMFMAMYENFQGFVVVVIDDDVSLAEYQRSLGVEEVYRSGC
jgi:hypothetical protein